MTDEAQGKPHDCQATGHIFEVRFKPQGYFQVCTECGYEVLSAPPPDQPVKPAEPA